MPKYPHYELKLEGDPETVAFLKPRLPASHATIAGANAVRRAVATLFGGAVRAEIISVRRVPARTVRRRLRIP